MSNHARRHRPYAPPTRGVISMSTGLDKHEHLRRHLVAVGCTCTPDIDITTDHDGVHHAHIAHDTWCPLLDRCHAHTN